MPQVTLGEIIAAPEHQVRAVLLALCDDQPTQAKAARLLESIRGAQAGPLKRKAAADVFVCMQCDEPFSSGDKRHGHCRYHYGSL